MASKVGKNLNSYRAEFYLNPDWMDIALADLYHIGRVCLVLAEF